MNTELAALLADTEAFIARFVVLPNDDAKALLALYVAMTHAVDAFHVCGYVYVTAAEKGCGKSRLLELLKLIVRKGQMASILTASSILRTIGPNAPTLLVDEIDAIYRGTNVSEDRERMRAIFNAGYRRGNSALMSVKVSKAGDWEPKEFPTFGPKVLAGIDNNALPDTVLDRSFVIRLPKARRRLERFLPDRLEKECNVLRHRWTAWAEKAIPVMREREPKGLDELEDRAFEIAEPLAVIAELAGADWSKRGKEAVVSILRSSQDRSVAIGTLLLRAVREIFRETSSGQISTADLLVALNNREGEPWGGWMNSARQNPGLTNRDLVGLLQPYQIRPTKVRKADRVLQGYRSEAFSDAWTSFCPEPFSQPRHIPSEPEQPEQPEHATQNGTRRVPANEFAQFIRDRLRQ